MQVPSSRGCFDLDALLSPCEAAVQCQIQGPLKDTIRLDIGFASPFFWGAGGGVGSVIVDNVRVDVAPLVNHLIILVPAVSRRIGCVRVCRLCAQM